MVHSTAWMGAISLSLKATIKTVSIKRHLKHHIDFKKIILNSDVSLTLASFFYLMFYCSSPVH